jgi:hypothetical protein
VVGLRLPPRAAFLDGRENLAGYDVRSLLRVDAEAMPTVRRSRTGRAA